MNRYFGIAIDHGRSFDRWLREEWGADSNSRIPTKRGIIRVCLEAGISGIVVGTDFDNGLEAVVRAASARGAETWLGLPDQEIHGQYDAARSIDTTYPPGPALYMAKDVGAVGVKFSMNPARHARWTDVIDWLTRWGVMAKELDLSIIVEPYFRVDDNVNDRVGFLEVISEIPSVRFAKLDVHKPQTWSRQYGRGFSPWLARSEGLEFPAFCQGLEQSLAAGCVGTMVGAAVWGIKEPLLGDKFTKELNRRLALIRNLVKPKGPQKIAGTS